LDGKNKSNLEFLINDFNDISEKLESTDKKIQFSIQLFGIVISALITLMGAIFLSEKENSISSFKYIIMLTFVFISIIMGEFIYYYNLCGHCTHSIYVNRMNIIRKTLYTYDHIKHFRDDSFTNIILATGKNMNYTMLCFITVFCMILSIFMGIVIWEYNNKIELIFLIIIILVLINVIMNLNIFWYKKKTNKTNQDINCMWNNIND